MRTTFEIPLQTVLGRRAFIRLAGITAVCAAGWSLAGCAQETTPQSTPAENSSNTNEGASAQEKGLTTIGEGSAEPDLNQVIEANVDSLMNTLTDYDKLCQLFVVTPEALVGLTDKDAAVTKAGVATQDAFATCPVGGIIYFAKNLVDEGQTRTMLQTTYNYAMATNNIPPLLCVDEEGGSVVRIGGRDGFSPHNVGDMADIGAQNNPELAKETAFYIGSYLEDLGFNTDFAPVCDIANNPYSSTMQKRSFGADASLVATMVAAQVEGFTEAGVLCSAKHFPGIGAAVGDSHNERIEYQGILSQLESTELVPFKAAIEAGVPLIMVGHMSLPAIVGNETPACLSRIVVTDILRNGLGFEGVIITDSLQMDAVDTYYSQETAAVQALQAGCDMLLMPESLPTALNAVSQALDNGLLSWDSINASVRRILRAKAKHSIDL